MIEKRAAQRHRIFKGATIAFADSGIACTVRNVSEGGAAVDLEVPVTLPQSFTLFRAIARAVNDHSHHVHNTTMIA